MVIWSESLMFNNLQHVWIGLCYIGIGIIRGSIGSNKIGFDKCMIYALFNLIQLFGISYYCLGLKVDGFGYSRCNARLSSILKKWFKFSPIYYCYIFNGVNSDIINYIGMTSSLNSRSIEHICYFKCLIQFQSIWIVKSKNDALYLERYLKSLNNDKLNEIISNSTLISNNVPFSCIPFSSSQVKYVNKIILDSI